MLILGIKNKINLKKKKIQIILYIHYDYKNITNYHINIALKILNLFDIIHLYF